MATLFSYFGKPKAERTPDRNVVSLKRQPVETENRKVSKDATARLEQGDVIWAKLDGHPWWPAMVCQHPSSKIYNRKQEVHVQFFGQPPSRSWVNKSDTCGLNEKEPDGSKDIQGALSEAQEALKLPKQERIVKLYACVPSDEELISDDSDVISSPTQGLQNGTKRSHGNSSSDEEEVIGKKISRKTPKRKSAINGNKRLKKRAKLVINSETEGSSCEEDAYKPESDESSDEDISSAVEENEESPDEESGSENDEVPTKKRKRGSTKSSKTPAKSKTGGQRTSPLTSPVTPKLPIPLSNKLSNSVNRAQASLAKFSAVTSPAPANDAAWHEESFVHQKLKFLQDGHRKDKQGHLHTDQNYDKRTLLVPESYLKSKEVTPAMRQWWILKSDNFDTVLFFKVGKFYELYHMDATTGVKELGLLYMKGNFAHAGFPEIAFSRYSDLLVQKGYKVARVEQTETPQMMNERCSLGSSKDKVVKREICAVISKGTKTYNFMEGDSSETDSAYLLAFCEKENDDSHMLSSVCGVCFVDTSIGKFHIGQFKDDKQCSRFRTLISHYKPAQVLFERNGISSKMQHVLNHELTSCIKEPLTRGSQFWDAKKTLESISECNYFGTTEYSETQGRCKLPETLQKMVSDCDSLGLTADDNYHLAISCLGACIWYLKKCCLEQELLSMSQFEEFVPVDSVCKEKRSADFPARGQHLILDAVTLSNLDVVANEDGTLEGTLIEQLDHCCTPFGKRLLKQWVCAPLCSPSGINDRLDAIDDVCRKPSVVTECRDTMKSIPDLERLLRRIHALGSLRRSKDHPDSRAILYNEDVYGKRKIHDLLSAFDGFEKSLAVRGILELQADNFRSKLLRQVTIIEGSNDSQLGRFPDLQNHLKFFKDAFDHEKAKKDGVIIPKEGVHLAYDEAMRDIAKLKRNFDCYLEKQKKRLGCKSMTYWGSGKTRYQLEVPDSALRNNTPDDYHLKSQKKGFRRFWTDDIEGMLKDLENAEERRDAALKDTMRNIFEQFDKHRSSWEQALECIAVLDCLLSLAFYRSNSAGDLCRPVVIPPKVNENGQGTKPFLEILNSKHPCVDKTFSGGDFIPNDIIVGLSEDDNNGNDGRCVVVTGPNMGGKSTLMRQAGLLTIMAQIGSYVPAEKCQLTPADRIFTRLGAHDRILQGESTFFVELSETSTILQHATEHSLVLLDELGRGTATYDGTAIASAVIDELSQKLGCRTLFSTHYHSLVDELSTDEKIKLGHMACMVENEDEDGDPTNETITFLYRFTDGACPKSYGFNAAKLAGIPNSVIRNASQKAKEFEASSKRSKLLGLLFDIKTCTHREVISSVFQRTSI